MYSFNIIDLIYLILALLVIYLSSKLAVRSIMKNNPEQIKTIIKASVIEAIDTTDKDINEQ